MHFVAREVRFAETKRVEPCAIVRSTAFSLLITRAAGLQFCLAYSGLQLTNFVAFPCNNSNCFRLEGSAVLPATYRACDEVQSTAHVCKEPDTSCEERGVLLQGLNLLLHKLVELREQSRTPVADRKCGLCFSISTE